MPQSSSKLRIVLTSPPIASSVFGGGQTYVFGLAKALVERGQQVTIVAPVHEEESNLSYSLTSYLYEGITITGLRVNHALLTPAEKYITDGKGYRAVMEQVLTELAPDMVHINWAKSACSAACRRLGIPHVVTAHHAGITCPAGDLLRLDGTVCAVQPSTQVCISCCTRKRWPKFGVGRAISCLPRWVYQPLGQWLNCKKRLSYLERGLIYPWLVEQSLVSKQGLCSTAQRVIVPSRFMRELLLRCGYLEEQLTVVPHGIMPVGEVPLPERPGKVLRLGYVGRINEVKGLHVLVSALERLSPQDKCELHIFGNPQYPWEEAYYSKTLTRYRGECKIVPRGRIAGPSLVDIFAEMDVLVMPSLVPESFGLVVSEAFSAGRPVIVSDAGALPELVRDGVDGFVVERGNIASLARAIQKLLDVPHRVTEMAQAIQLPKTVNDYASEVEAIYSAEISQNKR